MKKIRMTQVEAGPDGCYNPGDVRFLENAEADARIKANAAVEVKDGAVTAKKETATERRAREKKEREDAAEEKAAAEAAAKAKVEADNVAKGLNPDGSKKA